MNAEQIRLGALLLESLDEITALRTNAAEFPNGLTLNFVEDDTILNGEVPISLAQANRVLDLLEADCRAELSALGVQLPEQEEADNG